MKKLILMLITIILFQLVSASSYNDWNIELNSKIQTDDFTASGNHILGTKLEANDNMDIYDARMITPPSYSIPFYSIIENEQFMVDYKSPINLYESKSWNITQKGSSEFRRSGTFTQEITWNLNIPQGLEITLIDYGTDATRTNTIQEIDLNQQSDYTIEVTQPYNEYRYFTIKATLNEIVQEQNPDPEPTSPPTNTNSNKRSYSGSGAESGSYHAYQDVIILSNNQKNEEIIRLGQDDTIRLNTKEQGFFERIIDFFKNLFGF